MFKLKIEIKAENAIANGKATFGAVEMQITDEMVASMSANARHELIAYLKTGAYQPLQSPYPISEPTADQLQIALCALHEQRVAEERQREEDATANRNRVLTALRDTVGKALDQPEAMLVKDSEGYFRRPTNPFYLPDWAGPMPAELKSDIVLADEALDSAMSAHNERRAAEIEEEKYQRAKRAEDARLLTLEVIHRRGTASQAERFEAGLLPEEELKTLIRDDLFCEIDEAGFARHVKLRRSDALHTMHASYDDFSEHSVSFGVTDAKELPAEHWETYKKLNAICETLSDAEVELRDHWVVCDEEQCPKPRTRYAALVTRMFNGEEYSRSYSLGYDVDSNGKPIAE